MNDPSKRHGCGHAHDEAWAQYIDYRAGLCECSAAAAQLAAHVSNCPECSAQLEVSFRYFSVVRVGGDVCAPQSLRARIIAATIGRPR